MPRYTPFDWYEQPLYYDIIFDTDTRTEADFLEAVIERYVRSRRGADGKRRVLEPACGSGRLVAEMARHGHAVTGFDLCDGMVDFARRRMARRKLDATIASGDMTDFSFRQRFDLAFCLVSTFKYLPTDADAIAHLKCIAKHLKRGGVYALGLHISEYEDRATSRERWVASRGDVHVVCTIQGWPADPVTRTEKLRARVTATRRDGHVDRLESHWQFHTYDGNQLRAVLDAVPALELIAVHDFTYDIDHTIDFDCDILDHILILRRRA